MHRDCMVHKNAQKMHIKVEKSVQRYWKLECLLCVSDSVQGWKFDLKIQCLQTITQPQWKIVRCCVKWVIFIWYWFIIYLKGFRQQHNSDLKVTIFVLKICTKLSLKLDEKCQTNNIYFVVRHTFTIARVQFIWSNINHIDL